MNRRLFRTGKSRNIAVLSAAAVVLAAGLLVGWNNWAKNRFFPKKFAVVEPGSIYRSGQISRYLIEDVLKAYQIGTIIFLSEDKDLTEGVDRPDVFAEREAAKKLGVTRYNFPLRGDGTGDIVQYANAVEAMVKSVNEHKPVLVHCHTGSQRTGAAVAFYRLLIQHRDPSSVLAELKQNEHDPSDNPKLIPYINQNMPELARMLKERGVIENVPDNVPQLER